MSEIMSAISTPQRHALIRLTEPGWQRLLCAASAAEQSVAVQTALAQWHAQGWPLIVRRMDHDAAEDEVCVGLALPPDAQAHKLRIPLRVKRSEIAEQRMALPLQEVIAALDTLPAEWRQALQDLYEDANAQHLRLQVYGSLALQLLTGLAYLRATSDIDLLLQPGNQEQLKQGMALLSRHAQALPLDGEVLFGGGDAVAWKEWMQVAGVESILAGGERVLVKSLKQVSLQRVDLLLSSLSLDEGAIAHASPDLAEAPCSI
jgi:phosphoribosyl-dephospho-CoA transferase